MTYSPRPNKSNNTGKIYYMRIRTHLDCTVPGCPLKREARGLCTNHYYHYRQGNEAIIRYAVEPTRRPRGMTHEEAFRVGKIAVTDSGCIEWMGYRSTANYGVVQSKVHGSIGAHRVSLGIALGHPVPKGKHVLHRCDNPPCVNPDHLFIGTDQDNVDDMVAKGRHSHGSAHPNCRLTEDQVREIRTRRATEGTYWKTLAADYNVSVATIQKILEGKMWKHVA